MNATAIATAIRPVVIKLIYFCFISLLLMHLTGCQKVPCCLEPDICYSVEPCIIENWQTPFPKLSPQERSQEWGRELVLGKAFAREMDFYRAITCFKRAHFLIPRKERERRLEIEYDIYLSYYAARKYQDAIEAFEGSGLIGAGDDFPAFNDLLTTLYDAYWQTDQMERACKIMETVSYYDLNRANKLSLGTATSEGNLSSMLQTSESLPESESIAELVSCYQSNAKSVFKAKALNAILPGAGYYYVGQKKSAATSFVINALFIAATYQLFERGYIPAALITLSLEVGWYFGGINGAGLEAKQYNDCLYSRMGRGVMVQERLFPILMIQGGF